MWEYSNIMIYRQLKFINLEGEKIPYFDYAKNYLEADNPDVNDFYPSIRPYNTAKPITISWDKDKEATGFVLEYSTNKDMRDSKSIELGSDVTSYDFYNLLKGTTYYLKLKEFIPGSDDVIIKGEFSTTFKGPRVLEIDGIANTRDLGGYETINGKTIQGMLIRTGQFAPDTTIHYKKVRITEKGINTAYEELGIKTEIDLRQATESETPLVKSLLKDCDLLYYPIDGYEDIMLNPVSRLSVPKIFEILAQPKRYPIVFHCTGGADRTGTLAYLINGFLGVSDDELINDYEFSSFSYYGVRSTKSGNYATLWSKFIDRINACEGSSTKEKVTNFLLALGVSRSSLDALEKIMHGRGDEVEN